MIEDYDVNPNEEEPKSVTRVFLNNDHADAIHLNSLRKWERICLFPLIVQEKNG